jgi:DNA-binding CsgD family transcriptional regulator
MNDVWFCATRGRLADVRSLLQQFSSADRLKVPAALALRGIENALSGDVRGGVSVLRRAADRAEGSEKQSIIELALPYVISIGELDLVSEMIDSAGDVVSPLRPAFFAMSSVLATRRGFDELSRDFARRARRALDDNDDPMVACRTLQRIGLAAYFREDYDEAQERSLEAARAYERIGAYRGATTAYSVLFVIASNWLANPIIARNYAARITDLAERDGDQAMHNYGLVSQYELAAESGDIRRLGSIRARLLANPMQEQFKERFTYVFADSLSHAWAKRFSVCRQAIITVQQRSDTSETESILSDAVIALCDAAAWDIEAVRNRAHSVLQRTVQRHAVAALYDTQGRRNARILAASALIIAGEQTRGRRALGRNVDPDGYFARLDPLVGLAVERSAPMVRGYAMLINAVCEAAAEARPRSLHALTRAEFEVLERLATGQTRRELAAELGKTENTVMKQMSAIYAKLDASNRAQALKKARDLGIIS